MKENATKEYDEARSKAKEHLDKKLVKIEKGQREPKEIFDENLEILGEQSKILGKKLHKVASDKGT